MTEANVSDLQPPEPKAYGGWECRILGLLFIVFVNTGPIDFLLD